MYDKSTLDQQAKVLFSTMKKLGKKANFWSLCLYQNNQYTLGQDSISNVFKPDFANNLGMRLTVHSNNGFGIVSSPGFSEDKLKNMFNQAIGLCEITKNMMAFNTDMAPYSTHEGNYRSKHEFEWSPYKTSEQSDLFNEILNSVKNNKYFKSLHLNFQNNDVVYYYMNNKGSFQVNEQFFIETFIEVGVEKKGKNIIRSGKDIVQGESLALNPVKLTKEVSRLYQEGENLLTNQIKYKTKNTTIVLDNDIMGLLLHEVMGHPLEADRILGDERNFAGITWVKPEMFGSFMIGHPSLTVTFDPFDINGSACSPYDQEGFIQKRMNLVENGILKAAIGSALSQYRFKNQINCAKSLRASSWEKVPIDRMGNINIEPGENSMKDIISSIEDGIFLKTPSSWSVSYDRSNVELVAEYGQIIKKGKLIDKYVSHVGFKANAPEIWQNIDKIGDFSTYQVSSEVNCGKGETVDSLNTSHGCPIISFKNVLTFSKL